MTIHIWRSRKTLLLIFIRTNTHWKKQCNNKYLTIITKICDQVKELAYWCTGTSSGMSFSATLIKVSSNNFSFMSWAWTQSYISSTIKTIMRLVAFYFWADRAVLGSTANSAFSLKYSTIEDRVLINFKVRKLEIFALKCMSK